MGQGCGAGAGRKNACVFVFRPMKLSEARGSRPTNGFHRVPAVAVPPAPPCRQLTCRTALFQKEGNPPRLCLCHPLRVRRTSEVSIGNLRSVLSLATLFADFVFSFSFFSSCAFMLR